ncbi:MAG: DMP19 family protein [Planctomycetes bacterium]|nr:DMP19 family protein [Planctomycetota bacterium]
MKRYFTTVDALLDQDEASPLEWSVFDDELWLILSGSITHPSELENYPQPVAVYLASRWLEWEVGNGGFAQAAYNIPEWFELAATGYAALGKPKAVALIREALAMLGKERDTLKCKGLLEGSTIEQVFEHFSESTMASFDSRIPEDEWWIDELRVEYVRKNRDAFRGIK